MDVKMFQMDCGESILIHCDDECLLVDCGSRSGMTTAQPLFDNVINECTKYTFKQALITHFHDDHINGFMYITDKKTNFSRVYIPHIFTVGQHWNLIDYKLIEYYLSQKKIKKRKNFSLLDLLKRMVQTKSRITLLKRGSHFSSCNSKNDVLWPKPEELKNIRFDDEIWKYFPEDFCDDVFAISNQICNIYREANNSEQYDDYILGTINDIENQIKKLIAHPLKQNIDSDEFKAFYKRLLQQVRINDNNTSIVFQTNIKNNYLFTGDIGKSYLKNIVSSSYSDRIMIHDSFFAIKAPHHGTVTHYLPELFGTSSTINTKIVFISNGKSKSTGTIYEEYPKNANTKIYKLICTNRDSLKCQNANTTVNNNKIICSNGYCPLNNNCTNQLTFDIK